MLREEIVSAGYYAFYRRRRWHTPEGGKKSFLLNVTMPSLAT
ncbi:MAG TPA: hypothetical protein VNJ03_00540 [Vicinamibacterales bacterium]|nr:hypothetical protein [Vicinamibacterales bacterium]